VVRGDEGVFLSNPVPAPVVAARSRSPFRIAFWHFPLTFWFMGDSTENTGGSQIKIGLIGGSGLADAMRAQTEGIRHEVETPFGRPSDAIIETAWDGLPVFFLSRHGAGHLLGPSQVPFRANIFALKQLGVTHVIASGAVGSLRDEFKPRDLVIPDQVIDKTYRRAVTFFEKAAVHVEFAEPFCPVLRKVLLESAEQPEGADTASSPTSPLPTSPLPTSPLPTSPPPTPQSKIHGRGCYVCMEGPAFSTRAESLMHRLWGGDLIGMTAMPEAKLAREAEMSYALVALVTDFDCWRRHPGPKPAVPPAAPEKLDPAVLLKEIIANLQAATDNGIRLIRKAVARVAGSSELQCQLAASPARQALQLAIWSDKSRIPADDVQLLAPLWMKYFEKAVEPPVVEGEPAPVSSDDNAV
jgi:5'-methylthioadenosine phosphorylase